MKAVSHFQFPIPGVVSKYWPPWEVISAINETVPWCPILITVFFHQLILRASTLSGSMYIHNRTLEAEHICILDMCLKCNRLQFYFRKPVPQSKNDVLYQIDISMSNCTNHFTIMIITSVKYSQGALEPVLFKEIPAISCLLRNNPVRIISPAANIFV